MKIRFLALLIFSSVSLFGQHYIGVSSSLNRFDLFTSVDYDYCFENPIELGFSFGLGTISLFTSGTPLWRSAVRTGYCFDIGDRSVLTPTYVFSFSQQGVDSNSDFYSEHQIGYHFRFGKKIGFVQSSIFGLGLFDNQFVRSKYFSYLFKFGFSYVI